MADDKDNNTTPNPPESMEEDEMEMEIDETVPDTPIIENKRNSDDFLALMKETPPTATGQNPPTSTEVSVGSATESSSQETPKAANSVIDDDIQIVDVSTPKRTVTPKQTQPKRSVLEDDDVVCLDDDPKPKKRSPRTKPLPLKEFEIIDLVDSKKGSANSKCINYACKSGLDMSLAPSYCLTFYRVKSSFKKQEVCRACYELALQHYDGLAQSLINGDMLMKLDIPIRSDLVEIDDSDSEDEPDEDTSEGFDEANVEFLKEMLTNCMEDSMKKYKIEEHANNAMAFLKEKAASIKDRYVEVDTMLHDVRKRLDGIHHDLYSEFKMRYEHLPPLEITDIIYPTAATAARGSEIDDNERRSPRKTPAISYVELDDPNSSNSNSPALADSADSDFNTTGIEAIEIPPVPADLPPKGPIQKLPLKVGEMYYAVRFLTMGSWIRVRLAQIINPGSIVNGQAITTTMYCVSMEGKQQTKYPTNRLVSGKEIAYSCTSPVLLEVGTRIIAIFRETPSTGETKKLKKEAFYPGIIAEPCTFTNRYRYLIFFDDGYAQYVEHKYVHLIYESSNYVWEDMHIDSRPFIKKYLESYPERPMVKLRKDQTVRTEYNGKWWLTSVMNIDCSLVQMFFELSSRIEWIYRGSTRLNPMFKEELAASNRNNKSRVPRQFNETGPYVQYTREPSKLRNLQLSQHQDQPLHLGTIRSVARKSTSTPMVLSTKLQTVPFLPMSNTGHPSYTPPPSKVVYFTPRAQANTKTLYEDHDCSIKCKTYISYDVNKLKGYNPLSKPLLCGWNRVTYKHRGKREINYKAPCGRFIRNMAELHKYLRTTRSEMTVDLFDFDFWVHCLAEFVLERNSTINKDMSLGLENVAIPVVNYVDQGANDFCNYSIKREPMEGVHMNLDPEFLCGCDCEDDCEDKSKCQCWQLTLQGLPYLTKTMSPEYIGYTYRRLPEPVITGIYECNSRCKCAKTCLNRVVQNPLQLKLQVFKTNNRGWGIRCLNDIPQGAFICIYAGSILTEQMANEGGKNYGDEYLAELDYIEVVEKMKEDYEDDVVEDDDGKERDKSREESPDEEEEEKPENSRGNRKRSMEDDTDFLPSSHVPKGKDSSYKTRLRRRRAGESDKQEKKLETNEKEKEKNKDDEDECVTISDDEDAFREPSSFNPKNESNLDDSKPSMYKSVREMFAEDECIYVMDAKVTGNIGRFLNHSCSPNVFVQNVFVDTHDLRFPWVAFFALTYIRAGTELTWNYNYDVGSVPGKVLYCHCSSQECRGRLL